MLILVLNTNLLWSMFMPKFQTILTLYRLKNERQEHANFSACSNAYKKKLVYSNRTVSGMISDLLTALLEYNINLILQL